MLVDNFTLYDLTGMAKNIMSEDGKDYYFETDDNTTKIFYNFCYNLHDSNGCSKSTPAQVSFFKDGNCTQIAGPIKTGNVWRVNASMVEIEMNKVANSKHIVKYQIECDNSEKAKNRKTPELIESKTHFNKEIDGKYETVLYFKSKYGCPTIDFYTFWKFLNKYDFIFASILILVGIFECILGQKLLVPTAFIITCASVIIVVVIFFFEFILPPGTADWIIWVILFIGLVIGIFAGYYVAKYKDKCLALVVGGVSGFFLGEFLFNLFGNRFGSHLLLVNILFVLISIAILVILSFFLSKIIFIFSTSLIGAYATIRGISFFAGGFPSEFTVIDITAAGEFDQLNKILTWRVYVYLTSMVVLCGLSVYLQLKINAGQKDGDGVKFGDTEKDDNLI